MWDGKVVGCPQPHEALLQGRTLLFIDDDEGLLRLVSRALEGSGAQCLVASTHDEAVRLAVRHPTLELAVLDFEMPDGDVADLALRLRSVRPQIRLIGTSGGDRRCDFERRGIGRFLGKPWGPLDLAHLLGG